VEYTNDLFYRVLCLPVILRHVRFCHSLIIKKPCIFLLKNKKIKKFETESCSRRGLITLKMKSIHRDKIVGLQCFDSMYRVHMGRDNSGGQDFIAQDL
jgi:hypothetical protein